jgi:hypothetical protein
MITQKVKPHPKTSLIMIRDAKEEASVKGPKAKPRFPPTAKIDMPEAFFLAERQ